MRDLAQRVPDDGVHHTVDVHALPDGRVRVGDHTFSAKEFADMLRRDPAYDGGPVRLLSCDAGTSGLARDLSRELGVPVTAPRGLAWTDGTGRVFASDMGPDGRPGWPPNGSWDTHHPDGTDTPAGNDGFHPPRDGEDPGPAPDDAEARGDDLDVDAQREADFQRLNGRVEENRAKQIEGDPNQRLDNDPNKPVQAEPVRGKSRTLTSSTARLDIDGRAVHSEQDSSSGGKDLTKTYMGQRQNGTQRVNFSEQIFPTLNVDDQGSLTDIGGTNRASDSEPKQIERLTRQVLEEMTRRPDGSTRKDLDKHIREVLAEVSNERAPDHSGKRLATTPDDHPEIIDRVLARTLPPELRDQASTLREAVTGDLRMLIDFPGRRPEPGTPTEDVCRSCQNVLNTFKTVFPNINIEARNTHGEVVFSA